MGSRVLLLEVDLRRPTLARQLDVQSGPGLAEVLLGTISLSEAVQSIDLELPSSSSPARERALDVLVAGTVLPPNPAELVESRTMESLLERAKLSYDLVVIDTPPLTAVSDAFPLLSKVDGVIIVGRIGLNRRDVARRLHETLVAAGAPLLGVVANGFKAGRLDSYGYGYNYTSGSLAARQRAAGTKRTRAAEPSRKIGTTGASAAAAIATLGGNLDGDEINAK
jgi:capsular exopolysaccharide synthesis family protein